jgi:predicted oxidoreductase (fatty acid repression mutant protein)
MMYSPLGNSLVYKERQQDLLREAARQQLIQTAKRHRSANRKVRQSVAGWVGVQMVKWGAKLQHYEPVPTQISPRRG